MKTKCTLFVSLFFFFSTAFSQVSLTPQRVAGGSDFDNFTAADITPDGGLILGGTSFSDSSGNKTENSRGRSDYWIVKYDNRGKIAWDKTIGGSNNENLTSVKQTTDGGYITGGYSTSQISGEKTENRRGGNDYWIVKLDNLGKVQWDKTIGGNNEDNLNALQQTSDGGYIMGGWSTSRVSGEKTENSKGGSDYWVVKTDALGNVQWNKTIGGSGSDILTALQQTNDGGYILGGASYSPVSGDKTEAPRGGFLTYDYWVVKLNSNGNIEWNKTVGGASDDYMFALQQTTDNGFIIGGYSSSNISGEKTEDTRGDYDYWVVKLNSSGAVQWDKTTGGSAYEQLRCLQETTDGSYILGGYSFSGISGEKTEINKGFTDYWVVKINGSGAVQWDKTIGGSDYDYLYSIREVQPERYIAAGSSLSGISGDKKITTQGGLDYWAVTFRYIAPLASAMSAANAVASKSGSKNFAVYPNPAVNFFNLQFNGTANFSLINQQGKMIWQQTIAGSARITINYLSPGVYYLKNNNSGDMQKLIITNK